jgi:hypothetical protein
MSLSAQQMPSPSLPGLHDALVSAAARRYPVWQRRRPGWILPVAFASLVTATGLALAASGVFSGRAAIDRGRTPEAGEDSGPYAIRVSPRHADPQRPICLQLQFEGSRPAYGCGVAPTAFNAFGVVVADGLSEASTQRVIYGLVSDAVASVSSLGDTGTQASAATVARPGLPGRYFSLTVANKGQIELVGSDSSGSEVARIGSHLTPTEPPLSREEAIAQGDPAGFAPTVVFARKYRYDGQAIDPEVAQRRNLVCVETRSSVSCFDSVADAQAFSGSLN